MQENKIKLPGTNEHNGIFLVHREFEPKTRLRFWEIDKIFKCPLVGMCLSLSEQKQLLKKSGLSMKKKRPYDMHEILVASADSENRLSKRIDNYLDRRFGREAAVVSSYDEEQFMSYFKTAFESGDYVAGLWAAAVRPELSMKSKKEIFGRIHMSMHENGHRSMELNRKLAEQEKKIA